MVSAASFNGAAALFFSKDIRRRFHSVLLSVETISGGHSVMSKNIAIITGASSGIGKAFLEEIVKERGAYGCVPFDEIWAVARHVDKIVEIKALLGEDRIVPVKADLSSAEDLSILADRLASEKPVVGLLINCAGMGMKGAVEDLPAKTIEDTVDVNCTSLAKLTRICMPYMIAKTPLWTEDNSPRIINIASSAGFLPQPGFAAYAASKAFVISFSRALYYELIDYNIVVTTVCPGPVKTDFQRKATGGVQSEFTGIRQYVVADPVKLAKAAIRASRSGRQILVYGFSQKALHVASKIIPTSWILYIEKVFMPVQKVSAGVEEEGSAPYVPEERRELESGASVEGIPAPEPEDDDVSVSEDKKEEADSATEETVKEPEQENEETQSEDKTNETA
ncbi:MAG: SDR family NAD(P)-dependent oxidoreductase [Ruminococcaceae bacterium]|nr:SDR family NAD(P)-dependent oxidoreductase [Oscillospiraceae bacterium]